MFQHDLSGFELFLTDRTVAGQRAGVVLVVPVSLQVTRPHLLSTLLHSAQYNAPLFNTDVRYLALHQLVPSLVMHQLEVLRDVSLRCKLLVTKLTTKLPLLQVEHGNVSARRRILTSMAGARGSEGQ